MVDILIISNDIACGVDYLHKLKPVPIIHRDLNRYHIKSSLFRIEEILMFL